MERRMFFGLSFLLFFLRLQIYEAIAAIFWQSASYVLKIVAFWMLLLSYYRAFCFWAPNAILPFFVKVRLCFVDLIFELVGKFGHSCG